jgi:hypothetical protein
LQDDYLIAIENDTLVVSFHGRVQKMATILESSARLLRLCDDGQESTREIGLGRDEVTIRDSKTGEIHHLRRLSSKPGELILSSLVIPGSSPVTDERALQIKEELSKRVRADQEAQRPRFERTWNIGARRPPASEGQNLPPELESLNLIAVKADNTAFLKRVVAEVGWIDSLRFGPAAAYDAFLLTQHSEDLSLMLAGLPKIKAEVEAKRLEGETYALLYDRIQLLLGRRQRYGTRMGNGLGMSPLSEYVKIFGASEVRFSSACALPKSLPLRR